MLKVGITGGIGSGKSTVCAIFESLNIPVYNSDIAAAVVTTKNIEVKNALIAMFGKQIYTDFGHLNRKLLAKFIFSDKEALQQVNSIIHPAVFKDYEQWCEKHSESPYTIKEAAIMFESGANKHLNKIITVFAPQEIRMERVMLREAISAEEVLKRMKNQMPEEEKIKLSDYVVYNDNKQLLIPQILKLDELFRNMII